MLKKIVSGGQTGVDRGALELAIELGIPHGGFCPKGRRSEDGRVPAIFQLEETSSPHYPARTALNVGLGDGTLLVVRGKEGYARSRGTKLTREIAEKKGKPWRAADPRLESQIVKVADWILEFEIEILNVAGPRESTNPGIQVETCDFLRRIIGKLREFGSTSGNSITELFEKHPTEKK
jgi:hypothetical protein